MTEQKTGATRERIYEYVLKQYGTAPEYLWRAFPSYAVHRRADNKKWYAIIMDIPKRVLGISDSDERIDVLDVKCDELVREIFLQKSGFIPAYHLNREKWIGVLLDGTVDCETVFSLIDGSYDLALGKKNKPTRKTQKSWLVPVNPKYYDIEKAFAESDDGTTLWKQSSSVMVGDTVYLYLAAPYSCIMYKCEAVEVDIPYEYADSNVSMKKVMKIKRLHTYDNGAFGIAKLKKYGVISVRGPRGVPNRLKTDLEAESEN